MFNVISDFFANNLIASIIVDSFLVLLIVSFAIFLAVKFKKALYLGIIGSILIAIYLFSKYAGLKTATSVYKVVMDAYIIFSAIILAPELRRLMEYHKHQEGSRSVNISSTQATIEAIADAVFDMSQVKVGALITIEQHISLEQYAERAITLNSDITKELLEQIFIKDSPLHDGGVIIRGNKIICAAAYYTLTQDQSLDKTIGSRHRAGVGISEITDSLTIIVSEETGRVHVANQGFMKELDSKNDLLDYLNTYLGKL